MHYWYNFLQARVAQPPVRVLLDQLVYSPPIIAAYFGFLGVSRGLDWEQTQHEVSTKLWPTMLVNWSVWFPAQAINMSIVPLRYRVFFANCVGFAYGIFLSMMANDPSTVMPSLAHTDNPP